MLRAVLFDLDDTLIDWSAFNEDWNALERRYVRGVTDYFADKGHLLEDVDAYFTEYRSRIANAWMDARTSLVAPHIGRIMLETAHHFGVPEEAVTVDSCLEAYKWGVVPGTCAFPDAAEGLKLLVDHGIMVGIVTNAPQPMVLRDAELSSHGLIGFFPTCRISAADVGVLKPHPAIFQSALDCLGVTADEAVFVGDDLDADIVGAKRVGMRSVLRITRRTEKGERTDVTPDASIHSLNDLPALLDKWFPEWRQVQVEQS